MASFNIFLTVLAAASFSVAAAMAVVLLRFYQERSRMGVIIRPAAEESLEAAAAELAEEAKAAEEIPQLKNRFDQLIAYFPLPALILDENLIITNLSIRAEDELDQPRRRRGLLEALESHDLENAAHQALESFAPVELNVRLYAAGRKTYHARLIPIWVGEKKECLVFLQDVAAKVDYGELRSQFAATVSHELRTPLAGIRALVETLQDSNIQREDSQKFLERIITETDRLTQLVDEILFLSSLESGATRLEGASELRPVAETLMEKLRPLAAKFEVKIECDIPDGLTVPLPERMASTVLSNLIENAIKYSGKGSQVELTGIRNGNQIKVIVRDDGIGIDAEHLPHIFERFYRVDKSRSRRLGGTGLGLSIVKHVVESSGGIVEAKSREGFGTEITVSFPWSD